MSLFLTDGLIIANPALSDIPKFSNIAGKAIYVVEHTQAGAIGVSLNQNFSKPIEEIAETLPVLKLLSSDNLLTDKVISGGPLATDIPWIFGKKTGEFEKQVSNDYLALNFSEVAFEQSERQHQVVCGIGSFGWGAGQLENELANGLWHYFPTTEDVLDSIPFSKSVRGAAQLLLAMKY
jgi:putative transcriptional regulator